MSVLSPCRVLRGVLSIMVMSGLLVSGCGRSGNEFETAPVSGTVIYNGKPLHVGSLLFVPDEGGPSAQANIDQNGAFTMRTYGKSDGAILGKHKVMIMAMTTAGETSTLPENAVKKNSGLTGLASVIPERFGDLEKSGLQVNVQRGKNRLKFELTDKVGTVSEET